MNMGGHWPVKTWIVLAAVAGLSTAIMWSDVYTPAGLADSFFYLIPLLLANRLPWRNAPFALAALFTILSLTGFLVPHPGISDWVSVTNRLGGIALLWALAVFMAGQRRALEEKILAVEAQTHAERAVLGAVTGRQSLEQQLTDSESMLNGILQSAMDAIITMDDRQHVILFNKAAEEMFRCPAAETIGQSIERFIPQRFQESHRDHVKQFGLSGTTNRRMGLLGAITGRRANGEEFPAEASISQITVRGGKYFTIILRDMSARQRIEQQLHQAERLAEVGTLAAGMAHEIGTPMNVILGRAEQLMRKTEDEATRKGLATITAQVERITKIMNQLLAFARRKPGERRPVNLGQSVEDCLEVLQERIRRTRIAVESRFETTLHPVYVHADPDEMSQVFLNLLINAIHAMPGGGTLRISLERVNGQVKAVIADTGHGIPEEDLPKIFHPFFTTKETGQGTGLGLTVVHNIVQEHGGSITVASESGKGSTFTVMLPAASSG